MLDPKKTSKLKNTEVQGKTEGGKSLSHIFWIGRKKTC